MPHVSGDEPEATTHEAGHAKTISGHSVTEIESLYIELSDKGVEGISPLAYTDGAEALAAIEVLLHRGEPVNEAAMDLYNKYVRRDK